MLKILKNLFQKKQVPEEETIDLKELLPWLEKKILQLDLNGICQNHLQKINQLNEKLIVSLENLSQQEISAKDQQQVEARVRNIVHGHKDNYYREVKIFHENLKSLQEQTKKQVQEHSLIKYQQILDFNKQLDKQLNNLAKRTAKSYQAAQHLFFDAVEEIFKILGELNKLVKGFNNQEKKINQILKINQEIKELQDQIENKKNLAKDLTKKEENIKKIKQELEENQQLLDKLNNSKELTDYNKIKEEITTTNQQIKSKEDEVYFFFSKLNKALKKYERIALSSKLIAKYLEDSINAFKIDEELKITKILSEMKNSLQNGTLNFEDKLKNKFIELINMAETGYLKKIKQEINKLIEKENKSEEELNDTIIEKIKNQEQQLSIINNKINQQEKVSINLKRSLEINLTSEKQKIQQQIEEIINVKLNLEI